MLRQVRIVLPEYDQRRITTERCGFGLRQRALGHDAREVSVAHPERDFLRRRLGRRRCESVLKRSWYDEVVADEDIIACGDRHAHRKIAGHAIVERERRPPLADYGEIAARAPDLLAQRLGAEQRAIENPRPVERG